MAAINPVQGRATGREQCQYSVRYIGSVRIR